MLHRNAVELHLFLICLTCFLASFFQYTRLMACLPFREGLTGHSRGIISDNGIYGFEWGGKRYNSGFTGSFQFSEFVETNFDLTLDCENYQYVLFSPGILDQPNNLMKSRRLRNISIYSFLDGDNVIFTLHKEKWKKRFDYDEYKNLAFEKVGIFSTLRDMLSGYLELIMKVSPNPIDLMYLNSLRDSLVNARRRYGIRYGKVIEDSLSNEINEKNWGVLRNLSRTIGDGAGAFVSQIIDN
ncbi:MAG: hypothetical protein ACK5JF_12325, partial [Oscillospiraceae bacterium]